MVKYINDIQLFQNTQSDFDENLYVCSNMIRTMQFCAKFPYLHDARNIEMDLKCYFKRNSNLWIDLSLRDIQITCLIRMVLFKPYTSESYIQGYLGICIV